MKLSRVCVLFSAAAILPAATALAEPGAAPEPGAVQQDNTSSTSASAPGEVDTAARLAAMQKQLDTLKEEMETQKALLEAGSSDQAASKADVFRLYGWADMGMNKVWAKSGDSVNMVLPTKAATFVLGNLNLYLDIQPSEKWSALIEVRLTTLINGVQRSGAPGEPYKRLTNQTLDTSSPDPWTTTDLGSLILERAYIQYRHNDLLQLRVGSFLTPFGIWNVDHGAPTLIALALPVFMLQNVLPRTQLGAQLLGNLLVGSWDLGYSLTVSNGRNASVNYDPTNDKMFGGRITARTSHPWRLQLGLSALSGRYSDTQPNTTSYVPFKSEFNEVTAYRETVAGADISLDVGGFRLRTELSRAQKTYEEGKRDVDYMSLGGNGKYADSVVWDWYVIAAYRLPWIPVEPYLYYEYFKWPTGLGEGYMAPSAGVNVYFTSYAQLKIQYIQDFYFKKLSSFDRASEYDKKLLVARLVLGF